MLRSPPALAGYCLAWLFGWTLLAAEMAGQEERRWVDARLRMVREEVAGAGVTDERVLAALRETPRHLFVPAAQQRFAYFDMALPIGGGQTISPPFVVASMTQALNPQPADKVLEIGTGSGYQAAVLSHLVAEVYSIEIVESLGRTAEQALRRLNYTNVHTRLGDGFQGWPEHAPFDKIIVTCSPEQVPTPLVEQLREGGTIVVPLGERYQQTLYRLRKVAGKLESESLEPTFFVPMTGTAEDRRQRREESGLPNLVNGGFEALDAAKQPLGWYYVRQAEILTGPDAAAGERSLRFRNETAGRGAQALQALGIDGRQVQQLEVSLRVQTRGVRPGQSAQEVPRLGLSFFDEQRAPLGTQNLGPWIGTTSWTTKQARIRVPARCRLAVLAVGMFGAVGELSIDQISVKAADE
ncbi:MAG: protein-L-isoaspartate(D-aspartate) O-methyltransferase [Pirellulaceae bacterium]|nr:protein-L-isoaspartate(D-aspartate) O-methyltransferase [Pirellulaceae bacterium]